jgi:hypothetical protein
MLHWLQRSKIRIMRRCIQVIFATWFAITMTLAQASILAAQTTSSYGSEPDNASTYSARPSSSRFDTNGSTPVQSDSEALTEYLKQRRLPLVGAQVLRRADGSRMVVLYGFVGSDFGKADAAEKTRTFLHDSSAQVDNRINVRPELLASNRSSSSLGNSPSSAYPAPASSSSASAASASADTSAYPGPESYKAQQASPYAQQLTSMMPLIALLGVLGMGIAGGSSGFSFGSSPFARSPYGGSYSSPYGPAYSSPYGSPYAGSPFGAAPYANSPSGTSPYSPAPYPYP